MTTRIDLVLLPGLLADARLWAPQAQALGGAARTIVADLTGADSMGALAEQVLANAPERFALAGLSMGGYLAFEIMRRAPERVLGLALLDTSARTDTAESAENRRRLMALAETDFPAVVETLLPRLLHPAHLEDRALVGTVKAMAASVGKDAFVRQQRAILGRADSEALLLEITCPTLIACGHDDLLTPIEVHEEMFAGIENAQFEVIPECGHLSTLEQPQRTSELLAGWLARLAH